MIPACCFLLLDQKPLILKMFFVENQRELKLT